MPVLDVPCRQCLVDYYEDDIPWHHRLVLVKGDGLNWIWLTPDGEVQRADLGVHRVVPLRRGGVCPANCVNEGVYGFDPLAPNDLEGYLADARAPATILGFPDADDQGVAAPRALTWFVADPVSDDYGFELPPDAVANPNIFVRRGDVALVEISGRWTTAASTTPPDTWEACCVRAADGKARGPRLLGDFRDHDNVRHLPFREALLRS